MSEQRLPYDTGNVGQGDIPRLTARVSAQERAQINIQARIEELGEDMNASFKAQTAYLEKKIDALDQKIDTVDQKIDALETRMLDAFKQLVAMIDARLPPPQA